MTNNERIVHLLEVLQSYAPPTAEGERMVAHFASRHQTTDEERILELVGTLYDGVAYGNWPWVIAKLNRRSK